MATKKQAAGVNFGMSEGAKAPAKKAANKGALAGTMFRSKIAMAGFADGSTTMKQAAKAAEKLATTLRALSDGGAKLESPVGRNVAIVTTTDSKLAKKHGMAPAKAAPAKKAAAKKAVADKKAPKSKGTPETSVAGAAVASESKN